MVDLYVYYMVRPEQAAQAAPLVRAMQSRLCEGHGIRAELKRKPHLKDGMETWMEVYSSAPDTFPGILAEAASAAGLPALIESGRHTEVFVDFPACA